jgi:8-oxo-dGTP diphosphatase
MILLEMRRRGFARPACGILSQSGSAAKNTDETQARGNAVIRLAYRYALFPARVAYYKLFRPSTFGVKVVIEDERSADILLVRHSYGDRGVWHIPGGGYRPRHETPEQAARREVREELGLEIGALTHLGEYRTDRLGNRDTAQIFSTVVREASIRASAEIDEYIWASRRTVGEALRTYGVTKHAINLLDQR